MVCQVRQQRARMGVDRGGQAASVALSIGSNLRAPARRSARSNRDHPAQSDLMVFPRYSQEAAEHSRQLGKSVEYNEIPGDGGHIDAIYNIGAVGDLLRGFLSH